MRLIDADALNLKLVSLDNIARSPSQKALLGRVFYIVEQMPTVGGWISVKDRLPKDFGEVITAVKYSGKRGIYVQTGEWTGESWVSVWDEYLVSDVKKKVLYWMPLPNTEGLQDG